MIDVDQHYNEIRECVYKNEHYSVRNNGAVMRHPREGKRIRKDDNLWTFGKPNAKTGYMEIAGERIHRIVAFAFLGNPPTSQHVVDHIDTNRRNNRPENLRWLTRLENVLNNPITRARIELICGSIKAFLDNPSLLRGHEKEDPNFEWMRTVSPKEAKESKEKMEEWAKNPSKPKGEGIGQWVYEEKQKVIYDMYFSKPVSEVIKEEIKENEDLGITKSLSPNAIQLDWFIPSVFPCCPKTITDNPLEDYMSNLKKGEVFCTNEKYSSIVDDSAFTKDNDALVVKTKTIEGAKDWALAKITFKDGLFVHESIRSFFKEDGATKYFTIAQGKEWTGGDVFDDYC